MTPAPRHILIITDDYMFIRRLIDHMFFIAGRCDGVADVERIHRHIAGAREAALLLARRN